MTTENTEQEQSSAAEPQGRNEALVIRRCPRCGGLADSYVELWKNCTIEFIAKNGIAEAEGNLAPGQPYAVEANCGDCGHTWRLRRITQITAGLMRPAELR